MTGDNFSSKHNGEDNSFYGNSTDEFSDYAEKVYKEITEHDYKKNRVFAGGQLFSVHR